MELTETLEQIYEGSSLLPKMGCKGSKRGTSLASLYSEAKPSIEGGAERRMRVKNKILLTRISGFRKAQAEIKPSPGGRGENIAFTLAEAAKPLYHSVNIRKTAFTLAEVLITLGIIGVVAALTLPAIIGNYQEKVTVNKLKKVNSLLANSFKLAESKYGEVDTWAEGMNSSHESYEKFADAFISGLQVQKKCYGIKGCFPNVQYEDADHYDKANYYSKYVLTDGTLIAIQVGTTACNGNTELHLLGDEYQSIWCSWVYVDINGYKGPNASGKDLFKFDITKRGVIPAGIVEISKPEFAGGMEGCNSGNYHQPQYNCSAWVIYNGNMKYPPRN